MSDEYLWSKKGSDGEVERLEDLLSKFQYVPDRSFASPVAESEVEATARRRFRWVFAFAAPVFATLFLGMWFIFQTTEGSLQARKPISKQHEDIVPNSVVPYVETVSISQPAATKMTTPKPAPTVVKTIFRSRKTRRQQIETLTAVNKLTSEEKYAYDRLMLALSIAGNKLKVVQDTIDRKSDFDHKVINSNK